VRINSGKKLIMPGRVLDEIENYSRALYPVEVCGILSGKKETVKGFHPVRNMENSSESYFMEPEEQYEVDRKIKLSGDEMLGIFHSHPDSPPRPSGRDIEKAFYKNCYYVITSLCGPAPDTRAYKINDENVREVALIKRGD